MRRAAFVGVALAIAIAFGASASFAEDTPANPTPAQVDLEKDLKAGEQATASVAEAPAEAPPPIPYKKTFVLDSSMGATAFLGEFGKVAPPGLIVRTQLGYELLKWLMVLGEGEISFTDTSRAQDPPRVRSFPIFGFGAGIRLTVRFTDRFGVYLQPTVGALKADVPTNGLGIIGFRNAEDFGLYAGLRGGLEWYQLDRHFGLGLTFAIRQARGFEKTSGSDSPLAGDVGLALRYAF